MHSITYKYGTLVPATVVYILVVFSKFYLCTSEHVGFANP
jgi:hypothetical protein